jgi:hypothetical protein
MIADTQRWRQYFHVIGRLMIYTNYASLVEMIIWLIDMGEAKEKGKVYTSDSESCFSVRLVIPPVTQC